MDGKAGYQIREQMCEVLYEKYRKPIEWYLMGWVHNQEIASDLCQDTFEYLCRFLLTKETVVQPAAKYKTDLYITARNRAIDYLRKHNKPVVYLSQAESEADSWPDELSTAVLEARIKLICTQEDLLQLPEKQRYSLVKYALGHTEKEIADKRGISKAAVSGYMKKGRENLRKKHLTPDLQRAQVRHAEEAMAQLLQDVTGVLSYKKYLEYEEKALDWTYRQYMREHSGKLRAELLHPYPWSSVKPRNKGWVVAYDDTDSMGGWYHIRLPRPHFLRG